MTDSQAVFDTQKGNDSGTPRNLFYKFMFISEDMVKRNKICGGVINSTKFDNVFCGKASNECDTISHKEKKSTHFVPDTIYILASPQRL